MALSGKQIVVPLAHEDVRTRLSLLSPREAPRLASTPSSELYQLQRTLYEEGEWWRDASLYLVMMIEVKDARSRKQGVVTHSACHLELLHQPLLRLHEDGDGLAAPALDLLEEAVEPLDEHEDLARVERRVVVVDLHLIGEQLHADAQLVLHGVALLWSEWGDDDEHCTRARSDAGWLSAGGPCTPPPSCGRSAPTRPPSRRVEPSAHHHRFSLKPLPRDSSGAGSSR